MLSKKIKDLKLEMPPTREILHKICEGLNLNVPSVRQIECILFCRGIQMEHSDPESFELEKFIQWFHMNLKSFPHTNNKGVDTAWLASRTKGSGTHRNNLPLPPLKPDP